MLAFAPTKLDAAGKRIEKRRPEDALRRKNSVGERPRLLNAGNDARRRRRELSAERAAAKREMLSLV